MRSIRSVVACLSLVTIAREMNAAAGLCVHGTSAAPGLLRLTSVPGHDQNRVNDVLLLRPATEMLRRCDNETENRQNGNGHVVFFPGDIQVGAGHLIRSGWCRSFTTTVCPPKLNNNGLFNKALMTLCKYQILFIQCMM